GHLDEEDDQTGEEHDQRDPLLAVQPLVERALLAGDLVVRRHVVRHGFDADGLDIGDGVRGRTVWRVGRRAVVGWGHCGLFSTRWAETEASVRCSAHDVSCRRGCRRSYPATREA